ncbi:hypothetical protein, partial [Paraburkholderia sabiae]|uniref:hypothetical protein n=1 Tax=Paraburkholderia sabiae TaxID=273251 RepID=UPI001F276E88
MVFFASQGMVESGRLITRKCQPCPCTPVSYVSSLYTAAKKSRCRPAQGQRMKYRYEFADASAAKSKNPNSD